MKSIRVCNLLIPVCLFFFISCGSKNKKTLFIRLKDETAAFVNKDSFIGNYYVNKVNIPLLQDSSTTEINMNTPSGKKIVLVRKNFKQIRQGEFTWHGQIKGDKASYVIFSVVNGFVSGQIISSDGKIIDVHAIDKDQHLLNEQINNMRDTTYDDVNYIDQDKEGVADANDYCIDPPNRIDILILYTPDALRFMVNDANIRARVTDHIGYANDTYLLSGIDLQLFLTGTELINYTESGNAATDLANLENGTSSEMVQARQFRNNYNADIVILLSNGLDVPGKANIMSPVSTSFASSAFAVLRCNTLLNRYEIDLAHEVGHIMSARHDWIADNTNNSPYSYNHGSLFNLPPLNGITRSYRTVMSYPNCGENNGACQKVYHWSNPSIDYIGADGARAATGTEICNNALTLNNTRSTVANFRCRTPLAPNVWMRDTYNDTGLEPDPNTAGESMYMSPYIWIRNLQDNAGASPPYPNQHLHQNPITGQFNWVYVKMHNGGPTMTGHLKLYIKEATPGAIWPDDWTEIKDTLITVLTLSSKIVEVPWNVTTGTGHYCITAWWVCDQDPMNFVPTNDIGYNTRQSNNIIWRNFNIVDMGGAGAMTQQAIFKPEMNSNSPFAIEINDPAEFPLTKFIESGTLILKPDSTLLNAWKNGGSRSKGLNFSNNVFTVKSIPAYLYNINPANNRKSSITLNFLKTNNTIRGKYLVKVEQQFADSLNKKKSGGLAYEIYTYKRN